MRRASNIYVIGITAIAFLASSCGVETNATQTTLSQDVAALQQHPENKSSSSPPAPSSSAPKVESIPVGKMANVRSDRAVKVEAVKLLDRVVVDNQFYGDLS
jgi:PBP1b-binding outer membrane lipoprotein LpoB